MGENKKERKSNLLTVRLTSEELNDLDLLSDRMDKNRSDTMVRACKLLLNMGDQHVIDKDGEDMKKRKIHRVHLRMTDADVEQLKLRSDAIGVTISVVIREAIKFLAGKTGIPY